MDDGVVEGCRRVRGTEVSGTDHLDLQAGGWRPWIRAPEPPAAL
jgi:hypothetical protein